MKTTLAILVPRRSHRLAFTLVELMVVIAIIGILAALLVSGSVSAFQKARVNRVKAELEEYKSAIESYKSKLGFYPPDNPNNPASPPLFYELMGVYTNNSGQFQLRNDHTNITSGTANSAFGRLGFANQASTSSTVVGFLPSMSEKKHTEMFFAGLGAELLTVPIEGPAGPGNPNPWRYVSSNPTNNPKSYDLWADIVVGGQTITIGNWKSSQ